MKKKELKERVIRMAEITWNAIGSDILKSLEQEGLEPVMPREEVVEVVSDADHMLMWGEDKEAYQEWKKLPFDEKEKMVKAAFPHKTYGW